MHIYISFFDPQYALYFNSICKSTIPPSVTSVGSRVIIRGVVIRTTARSH